MARRNANAAASPDPVLPVLPDKGISRVTSESSDKTSMTPTCKEPVLKRTRSRTTNEASEAYLTPPEVAKLLRVSHQKVMVWIRRGELRAFNVGNGNRPRYRVGRDSLDAFTAAREVQPLAPQARRPLRRPLPEGGPLDPILGEQLLKKKQAVKLGNTYYRIVDNVILFL